MVCWFICYCLSDVTYYKTVHACVCVFVCVLLCTYTVFRSVCVGLCIKMCTFVCSQMCVWCMCLCMQACVHAYVFGFSGVCFVCVSVTDIIWCRLVGVLRLQSVSQRLIDKWIWFANVIKLIRKTAMGCWAQISQLQYLCFFLSLLLLLKSSTE